ncbi:hypothetical protein GCM10027614_84530 [Micromonospora vulcania]
MKKWEVFAVQNVEAAEEIINKLVSEGYEKEDISVLAKSKHNKNLETLAEKKISKSNALLMKRLSVLFLESSNP